MSIPKDILKNSVLSEKCVLHGYRGSLAHGMYVPNTDPNSIDDIDTMAVYIEDLNYYFGLKTLSKHSKGTIEIVEGKYDIVCYELRKFIYLLANGNPNVLSLLWLKDNRYIKRTNIGQAIIDNRELFVNKKVFHSFKGYAHGQFNKMTHCSFLGYMGEKRKKLVKKYGYDCKNAAHLIRLLRMGIEFLIEGTLHVEREDKQQLLAIKRGEWSLDEVIKESNRLFLLIEEAYVRSTLPATPDYDKINTFCTSLLKKHFNII